MGKGSEKRSLWRRLRLASQEVFLHLFMSLKQELISGGSGKPVYGNSLTGRFFPVLFRSSERTLE